MPKYRVTTTEGKNMMKVAGFAFQFCDEVTVEAADETEAYEKAKALKPGHRVKTIEQFCEYHITVKGREDGRKRQTFVVKATSEREATKYLSYNSAATRFAGYNNTRKPVKVVVKDA